LYLIKALDTLSKADFGFANAVPEQAVEIGEEEVPTYMVQDQVSPAGPEEVMVSA
jgi:hypothetical protein